MLLDIQNLSVSFETDERIVRAVDRVCLQVPAGKTVGLVGESGCGKSVTALAIPRLLPCPPARIKQGRIFFDGRDLLTLPVAEMRSMRGARISMIFQEPMTALSPLHRVGHQLIETLRLHRPLTRTEAAATACDWLEKVGIHNPRERMRAYPFQLSGGMRQRVMIAMALMLDPELVIADEPTTALDVTVQARILELMRRMRQGATAHLFITHDMAVIRQLCDEVVVMYAGQVVETGSVTDVFARPLHPYTEALLASIPSLTQRKKRLAAIPGQVPAAGEFPQGCRFADRCCYAFDRCRAADPGLRRVTSRQARCLLAAQRAGENRKANV